MMDSTGTAASGQSQTPADDLPRHVLDNLLEGSQVIGPDYRYLYINEAVARHGRTSRDRLLGRTMMEVYPGIEDTEMFTVLRRCMEQRSPEQMENEFTFPDGSKGWFELRFEPVPDGVAILSMDISARKRAEEARREGDARYRDLMDNIADLAHSVAPDGALLHVNRAWRRTLGYTEEEIPGLSFLDILHPRSREHCQELFREMLGQEGSRTVEVWLISKDGRPVQVQGTATCRFEGGRPAGLYCVLQDVTEKKQAEERQRNLEEQLRQAQKMEAIGRLAGGVAHDFNNMVGVITMTCHLALENLPERHPVREDLEEINQAASRAADLTRQLLAFSRRQVLAPRIIDLNEAVTGIEKMLRRLLGEDIELRTELAPGLGAVKVDPSQVEQIVMNLAVNARDAMPDGGSLTIETANVELDEDYAATHMDAQVGAHVMLAVSDTGTGMDGETRARVFEPFFTTKEQGKGTGLGLSTVYGIVKQSGGNIWVYSEPGEGTVFKIYLPVAQEEVEQPRKTVSRELPSVGSETILVAEDNDALRRVMARTLARGGYRVLEAGDGETALRLSREHAGAIDLLLTDVVMPRMSGRELAEQICAQRPETMVLFTSGYTDNGIVHHGVLEPGVAFLQKPFTAGGLLARVRDLMRGSFS